MHTYITKLKSDTTFVGTGPLYSSGATIWSGDAEVCLSWEGRIAILQDMHVTEHFEPGYYVVAQPLDAGLNCGLFTIHDNGDVTPFETDDATTPNLSTWPPK